MRFTTSYWYGDVDFEELQHRYGAAFMEQVYFHIAVFEINKLASLHRRTLDFGPFAKHHTEAFENLWRTVFHSVWAQWRYENDLPHYHGPELALTPRAGVPYANYAYASSIYGAAAAEHRLINELLGGCKPERKHRHWIYDDFMDSPVLELSETRCESLAAADVRRGAGCCWPGATAALAQEPSANRGNLI